MIAPNYTYAAHVTRIIDGDTLDITLDLGFHLTAMLRLRLARVNTPELTSTDPEIRAKAKEAKAFLEGVVLGNNVMVQMQKSDAFGRYLAEVWYMNTEQYNLSDVLLEQKLAVLYVKGGA